MDPILDAAEQLFHLVEGGFTGFKEVAPTPTDYVVGKETSVSSAPRNDSADWRPLTPDPKCQLMTVDGISHGDTEACTDFSGTNAIATQLDWLIAHGQVDPNGVNFLKSNGYIGADGKVNLSPRFTAVKSGTTPQAGNTLPNVGASMRHDGVVPDSLWPMPTDAISAALSAGQGIQGCWDAYYAPVSDAATVLGLEFTKWFDIAYQWIAFPGSETMTSAQFAAALQVAPIQIATAVCQPWNVATPINGCGPGAQHATTLLYVESMGKDYDILDHYEPYMKQLAPNYTIGYAMQHVVTSKPQAPVSSAPFTYTYAVNLTEGAPAGAEVKALQRGLQAVSGRSGVPYMKPGVFGPYGPQTALALALFQGEHAIDDTPGGVDFGPRSRAALTQALADQAKASLGLPEERPLPPGASSQH